MHACVFHRSPLSTRLLHRRGLAAVKQDEHPFQIAGLGRIDRRAIDYH